MYASEAAGEEGHFASDAPQVRIGDDEEERSCRVGQRWAPERTRMEARQRLAVRVVCHQSAVVATRDDIFPQRILLKSYLQSSLRIADGQDLYLMEPAASRVCIGRLETRA